ncbi:ABC transporter ATP-binding protein [uncultured Clostridium sp.]|uniref:ABC transporter ATP-binding protein n=1 Tax=uncultured Clostridium sp. TaxID=59620 RepID=UPI002582CEAA|nr:ABC transporter ATP-binding protein [uncultured Clostridium sp.]
MNPETEEKIYFYTEDLQVGYGGKQILNPVRIGIKKGEILTLVGPNGAGKSTILKSVAAQLPPLGGAVYLDGADLLGMKGTERARQMAVMFTEKVHAEWMTCRDVVAAGRYPYTGRFGVLSEEDWKAVDEAMEAVRVSELRERDFQTLSDGQRQRVMLARALCQEPELLLLDEPTSYLDIRYKLEFMAVLQELARRKKVAVILSIHELDLAERVSDWVLCVSPGQESRFGRPEEMLTPEHLSELFQVEEGRFRQTGGSMELPRPEGAPEVFVLAGGGSGRAVFWQLQRAGTTFAAGIISEADLDYPVACTLASRLIAVPAFEEISEEKEQEARECLDACQRVIACRRQYGGWAAANDRLLAYAREKGKKIEYHNLPLHKMQ